MSTNLSANFYKNVSKITSVISTFILGLSSLSFLPVFNSVSVHAAGRLIINEFVPAPSSRSCSSFGNQETVELFNSGDATIDYTTFFLRDKSGIQRNLSGVTIHNANGTIVSGNLVPVGGYLVFRTAEGWLNNTTQSGTTPTDGVYLYDNGVLVDSQDYNITDGAMADLVFRNNGGSFSSSFQSSFGRSNSGIQDLNCSGQSNSSNPNTSSNPSSTFSSNFSSSVSANSSTNSSSTNTSSNSSSTTNSTSSTSSSSINSSSLISSNNSNNSVGQFGNLKVCKEDNLQNKLSNWEFNIKNTSLNQNPINLTQKTQTYGTSTVVQTLSIDTANSGLTPSMDLPAGNYSITVSGKYIYGSFDGKSVEADGAYSFRPIGVIGGTDGWVSGDNLPSPFEQMLKVRANNQNLNFGSFNASNIYTAQISKGNGPINFSINDTAYQDNSGSLTIEITRIAETNGCTTFFNLPYSNYTVTEIMQPNWSFVKANSNSEMLVKPDNSVNQSVNREEETILTFVNKFTAPITTGGGMGPIYYGGGNNDTGGNGGKIEGNILAPIGSQNNMNSKPTAVKGVEDNEKDVKNSSNSQNSSNSTTNNQNNSQNNSQENNKNSLSNINSNVEYRIKLVDGKTPIETKIVSGNTLIRTGGSQNLELISGLMLIMMGTGLYFSFKQKTVKKAAEQQL